MSVNVKNETKFNGISVLTHMIVVESGFDMDAKLVENDCDENWIHNYCHMKKIQHLLVRDMVYYNGWMLIRLDDELWVRTNGMVHEFHQMNLAKEPLEIPLEGPLKSPLSYFDHN